MKTTNLIFAEHSYLLKENNLLKLEITELNNLNDNLQTVNLLNLEKIDNYENKYRSQEKSISDLNKQIDKFKKRQKADLVIEGCLVGGILSLVIIMVK